MIPTDRRDGPRPADPVGSARDLPCLHGRGETGTQIHIRGLSSRQSLISTASKDLVALSPK